MKILTDIIRRACKHFNIDPKDLCDDPDSSAQSKSSSREPAEGDENWDALDTTKRCTITAIISWKLIKGESRNVRISARRDAKSWKGVQGGARGRKWCWRYIWRCFWSVFVIETIIQEVLVLYSLFFFVLGVSWVQIWRYGSKVYFCHFFLFFFPRISTGPIKGPGYMRKFLDLPPAAAHEKLQKL